MESTSPGFAFELGAVELGEAALGAEDFDEAGEGWAAGFWAIAKQPTPKQSMKTTAMSFLMANNLTPIRPVSQTRVALLLRFLDLP
jgi:hypothetical protein